MKWGALLFLAVVAYMPAASAYSSCTLSAADKAANAKLSFDDFDQKGAVASTWRQLEQRGCHMRAAEAADDYLVNGPPLTPAHKSDVLFHEAQSLAIAGRNLEAARLVAAAVPPDHAGHGDLDWNAYLRGTWGFLAKDRSVLDDAIARMSGEPGEANRIDANVLRGLAMCFDRSYEEAYNKCRPKPDTL